MHVETQINHYISSLPEPKRSDLTALHQRMLQVLPNGTLWFSDGKDADGRIITNPTIGYGSYTVQYADGKTRTSFQIGLSANKTGISVYILGIKDKKHLAQAYGATLGKASITGYCIRFKTLKDIQVDVLESAIRFGIEATTSHQPDE